jgi:hypothetical protein
MPFATNKNLLANNALAAAESAEILFLTSNSTMSTQPLLAAKTFIGAAMLASFGIEMLLKSICAFKSCSTEFPRGHNLSTLFNKIPDASMRQEIRRKFEMESGGVLDAFLHSHAQAFKEWRYFSENTGGELKFSATQTRLLTKILKEVVLQLGQS